MKNTYANKPNTLQGFTSLYPYTKPSMKYSSKLQAFTIVELLIVIVVIAILATISIAAYTNIQQRAKNTAIINAASQSLKMIEAYVAEYGEYPAKSSACITVGTGCSTIAENTTFNTNMASVGTLPKNVPAEGDSLYGMSYVYSSSTTFNGESQPARLVYYLFGRSQQCGVSGVMVVVSANAQKSSTTGYSENDGTQNKTICRINIPGPAHS